MLTFSQSNESIRFMTIPEREVRFWEKKRLSDFISSHNYHYGNVKKALPNSL